MKFWKFPLILSLLCLWGSAHSGEPIALTMDVDVLGFDRHTPFVVVEPGQVGSVMVGNDEEGVAVEVLANRLPTGDFEFFATVSAWVGDSVDALGDFEGVIAPGEPKQFVIGDSGSPQVVFQVVAEDYLPANNSQQEAGG